MTDVPCSELLLDLLRAGLKTSEVARRIGEKISTVHYWRQGGEPRWAKKQKLIEFHASVCVAGGKSSKKS